MWHSLWGILFLLILNSFFNTFFGTLFSTPFDKNTLAASLPTQTQPQMEILHSDPSQESGLLWKNGERAFEEARYKDAVFSFKQIIDNYPGSSRALESYYFLGLSYLELHQEKDAQKALQFFIHRNSNSIEAHRARISLAKSFLNQKKWNEAYLTTLEVEGGSSQTGFPKEIFLQSLLIRAQSLDGLGKEERAKLTISSVLGRIGSESLSPDLIQIKSEALAIELGIKLKTCDFPLSPPLDESTIRNHFSRKGTCLMESLNSLHNIIDLGNLPSIQSSLEQVNQKFLDYHSQCLRPEQWVRTLPIRYPRRSFRFWQELRVILAKDCEKKIGESQEILESWRPSFSPSTAPILKPFTLSFSSLRPPAKSPVKPAGKSRG